MKQLKKGFFREVAEQWWDEQESLMDDMADLELNELEGVYYDEDEPDINEPV